MSILCTLSRVTPDQVQAMLANPAVVEDLLHDGDYPPPAPPGWFARLLGKKPAPQRRRLLPWIGEAHQYELDRMWQIVHFLLTGSTEGGEFPASFICNDGKEVGEDLGYGPPRLFTSAQARNIADHLAAITEEEVLRRYRPEEIEAHQVYYLVPDGEDEQREEALALSATIAAMAAFIDDTARRDCALVIEMY